MILELLSKGISLHKKIGNEIKAIHITSLDYEQLKEETNDVENCFDCPVIVDEEYTFIEIQSIFNS
jgi:hypothetical protein